MSERLRGLLRFAVGRPAVVFLAALGGVIAILLVASGREREPAWIGPLILGCLATAFVAVVQALRVLWHQSLPRFLVLGSLILAIGILYLRESGDMALAALAWSPLGLAAALELALRWLRASRGPLWLDRPAGGASAEEEAPASLPKPGFWRRHRGGCLGALALALLFLASFLWQLTLPGRHATAARGRLRPGMTVAEIVAVAEAPFTCTIVTPADAATGAPLYVITADRDRRSLRVGDAPAKELTPAGLSAELVGRGAPLSTERELWMWFTFRGVMLPLRVSFRVTLDEKGLLKEVGPSRSWD
jgi:hypothetical protein